ncbi:glycosyltransferase, partial [Candidatus Parcubacteria bacterium]
LISPLDLRESIFRKLYFDKKIEEIIEAKLATEKFDLVHFESYYTSFYISERLKKYNTRLLFGTENIENKTYKNYVEYIAPFLLKPIFNIEVSKIKKEEEKLLKDADIVIAVTNSEAQIINKLTNNKCFVVENGVDLDYFRFVPKKAFRLTEKNILFVGNFSYFPNIDAVKYFYNRVFKHVKISNIKFTIIGKKSEKISFINDKRVVKINYVCDIKNEYQKADVFVAPIRIGGGTNFKILEAMASGTPVITFSKRVKELGLENDYDIVTVENEIEFREKLEKLLEDEEFAQKIAKNARKTIEKNYSWETIGNKLYKIWKEQI